MSVNQGMERKAVEILAEKLNQKFATSDGYQDFHAKSEIKFPYLSRVQNYSSTDLANVNFSTPNSNISKDYSVDLIIYEEKDGAIHPRVIIEAKYQDYTTHDVITYSEKAKKHKLVHPQLRYGFAILEPNEKSQNVSWKLLANSEYFDFLH